MDFFHALMKACRSNQVSKLRIGKQDDWFDNLLNIHEAVVLFFKKELSSQGCNIMWKS